LPVGVERFSQAATVNEPFFGVFAEFIKVENEATDALLLEGNDGDV